MLRSGIFYPLLPRNGGEGEKAVHLYVFGGKAAEYIQINPFPRPWGLGVDVSRVPLGRERLGVGEALSA